MKSATNEVVVGLGEALWDMLPNGKQIGGAPANFAYHCAQCGLDAWAVSAIGKDKLGQEIVDTFNDKKLNYLCLHPDRSYVEHPGKPQIFQVHG